MDYYQPIQWATICLGVEGINSNEFERCFEIRLNDPTPLSVYTNDTDLTASADDNLDSVDFEMVADQFTISSIMA